MSCKFSVKFGVVPAAACVAFAVISFASAQTVEPQQIAVSPTEQITSATGIYLDAARRDPGKADEVVNALLSLDMAYYQTLLDNARNEDPEIIARILSVIRRDIIDTRIRRVLAILPKEDGEKLRKFQEWKPQLFRDFFSSELSDRIRAAETVGNLKDPQCLAEPLLVLCIKHPSRELVSTAIEAVSKGNYRSETMVDTLIDTIETQGISVGRPYYGYDEDDSMPPGMAAMDALQSIATPYASARLFKLIFSNSMKDVDDDLPLAEVLATTGDKRLIPHLIKELKNTNTRTSRSTGEIHASYARSDAALLVLLRLTGQNIADYNLVYFKQYYFCVFGFANDSDRKEAIRKFEEWWKENQSQPAYKDIEPLDLENDKPKTAIEESEEGEQPPQKAKKARNYSRQRPGTTQPETQPEPQPESQPDSRPSSQPETQPELAIPDIDGLKAAISAETQRLIKVFHDTNFRTRENAQAELLAVRAARDQALTANIDSESDNIRKLIVGVMANSMAEARITQTLIELDEADRNKLMDFRAKHNDIFRDAVSLTWSQNIRAVKKIGDLKLAEAEPLLLMTMKHSYEPVVLASIRAAGEAGCKSDMMVDALCKIIEDALPTTNNRGFNSYQFVEENTSSGAALAVLKVLKSPRCLPRMLALMKNTYIQYNSQALFIFTDVIASVEDINVIPELMKYLDNPRNLGTWSSGNKTMTMSTADPALVALVRLTRQKEKAYKLIRWNESYERTQLYGFEKEEDRTSAIAKFKEWWAKNKTEAPYKDIQPITLSE